jgi:hypothetical protein
MVTSPHPDSQFFECSLEKDTNMEVTELKVQAAGKMVKHLPVHGMQCVLDNAHHMGKGNVIQHGDIHHEYAGILSLDGHAKAKVCSTTAYTGPCMSEVLRCHGFGLDGDVKAALLPWLQQQVKGFFAEDPLTGTLMGCLPSAHQD